MDMRLIEGLLVLGLMFLMLLIPWLIIARLIGNREDMLQNSRGWDWKRFSRRTAEEAPPAEDQPPQT